MEKQTYEITPKTSALRLNVRNVGQRLLRCGDGSRMSVSPFFRFCYTLYGCGSFAKGGQSYAVEPGLGFVIYPDEIVSYRCTSEAPWHCCIVGFQGQNAQRYLEERGLYVTAPVFRSSNMALSQRCAEKLTAAAAASAVDDVLLGQFLLFFSTFETRISEQEKDTLYLYTEQACQYISENYAFALTVDDIADHVKVDRSYLYRLFKKRFGMSVQNYLLAVRLRNAACLLESSDMLTSEVCYASGFNDYSHFSKMFAKAYNMSPKDYRQRARQERNASELNA